MLEARLQLGDSLLDCFADTRVFSILAPAHQQGTSIHKCCCPETRSAVPTRKCIMHSPYGRAPIITCCLFWFIGHTGRHGHCNVELYSCAYTLPYRVAEEADIYSNIQYRNTAIYSTGRTGGLRNLPGRVVNGAFRRDKTGSEQQNIEGRKSAQPQIETDELGAIDGLILQGLLHGEMVHSDAQSSKCLARYRRSKLI